MFCRKPIALAFIALLTTTASGCQGKPEGVTVEGKVTAHGQPLVAGSIVFIPQAPLTGRKVAAPIAAGKFSVAPEAGLLPGKYRVEIYAPSHSSFDLDDPQQFAAQQARILPRSAIAPTYNTESKLVAGLQSASPNVLQFDVEYHR
jgi:hypothetical protein